MNLVLHILDNLAERLSTAGDVEWQALEARRAEAYRDGRLTKPELHRLLGFQVLYELDGFLKGHGVFEPYRMADLERERQTLDRIEF